MSFLQKTLLSWAWWKSWLFSWRWWWGKDSTLVADTGERGDFYPSVSVVIPAHNEEPFIEETIRSVLAQDYPNIRQIIVVADNCSDRTAEFARRAGATLVIENPADPITGIGSKSRAQNVAIEFVTSELVDTVDADTTLDPSAISRKMRFFRDPKTFAVSGFVRQKNIYDMLKRRPQAMLRLKEMDHAWRSLRKAGDDAWKEARAKWAAYKRANTLSLWEMGRFIDYLYCLVVTKPAQNNSNGIIVACGCDTIFRTDRVRELGGFKPRTLVEDMDLTCEGKERGWRVYHAPDSICYSMEPTTLSMFAKQGDRWYRGFFQMMKVRRFNLWPVGFSTALFAYVYTIMGVTAPLTFPVMVVMYSHGDPLLMVLNIPLLIGLILLNYVLFAWLWVVPTALRMGMFWLSVRSIPAGVILQYVNHYIYLRSIWMEVILNKTLEKWDKGHASEAVITQ